MLVNNYISKDFIPPNVNSSVGTAVNLLRDFNLTHIPLFEGLSFIGNISGETLEDFSPDEKLISVKDYSEYFYITQTASLFDAVQSFHNHSTNMLPVINEEKHYLGSLMVEDVISALSTMPFIVEPGAIMTVEIPQKQFSISEVSKIVESNNARITGLFVTAYEEDKVQITIKLMSENLASVSETFERFGYSVVHKFYSDEKEEMLRNRFEQLMKYLDI